MKPYVESGRHARELLEGRSAGNSDPDESRLMSSLVGFKQVINLLGVCGIALIPVIGLMTRSSFIAALVALNFLALILLLELMERRVKTALLNLRDRQQQPDRPEVEAEF